jgi:hypothetical protein
VNTAHRVVREFVVLKKCIFAQTMQWCPLFKHSFTQLFARAPTLATHDLLNSSASKLLILWIINRMTSHPIATSSVDAVLTKYYNIVQVFNIAMHCLGAVKVLSQNISQWYSWQTVAIPIWHCTKYRWLSCRLQKNSADRAYVRYGYYVCINCWQFILLLPIPCSAYIRLR